MSVLRIVVAVLQSSIFLIVCSLGMHSSVEDALHLLRRPSLLLRSILAMNVLVPLIAVTMAASFNLSPPVKAALILVAVSPVPPLLPRQLEKMGGSPGYVCGLLATEALFAIVLIPVSLLIIGRLFTHDVHVPPRLIAKVVSMTILLPLGLGMFVHRFLPRQAEVLRKPVAGIAFALFLVSTAVLLVAVAPLLLRQVDSRVIFAIIIFVVADVAVGHWLGGPEPRDRTVLAMATASRHPGLAIAIAVSTFPAYGRQIAALILLYVLVRAVVLITYNARQKHKLALHLQRERTSDRQAA
jgi:BASS family bile acid:Na+ symporter